MFKRFIYCSLIPLALASSCSVASAAPPAAKPKTAQVKAKSGAPAAKALPQKPVKGSKLFMWKMTSDSGATIYFLGTIHIARKDLYPLPDEIEKAFQKSKALMVEADISDQKHEASPELQAKMYLPKGDTLSQHISASTMRALEKYCAATDTSETPFMRMRPWLVTIVVGQIEMKRMGFMHKNGIDLHFINQANKEGKKVIGLEKDHDDVLAGMDTDLQDKMLRLSLINIDLSTPDFLNNLFKIWRTGDDKAMNELQNKSAKKEPELEPANERILYDRNEKMADTIEPYLKGDGVFMVAVGSAHLCGDRSIIELLKKRGYKANQVIVGDEI